MSDLKDQILSTVTGDMDVFKRIASKIPGFNGYIEANARRDSDKLVREALFSRFRELEGQVSGLQSELGSSGEIDFIDDLEKSAIKLRTFADRVRTARRGYAGLFDAVKVKPEDLDRLLAYDNAMLDLVDQVKAAIDNVQASIGTDGLPASVRNLESVSRQCVETFDRREEILTGAAGV
jgi:hypothetical protein